MASNLEALVHQAMAEIADPGTRWEIAGRLVQLALVGAGLPAELAAPFAAKIVLEGKKSTAPTLTAPVIEIGPGIRDGDGSD